MSTGYFQIEFSTDWEKFSDNSDDESDTHVHYQKPPPTTPASEESPDTQTPNGTNTNVDTNRRPSDGLKTPNTQQTPAAIPYNAFLCLYCISILITSCICRAYFHGILRLIQRTVSDGEMRVMALVYDIGLTFGLLPLCFATTGIHRPKLLGIGAFFVGLGFLFSCIPYFIMKTQLSRTSLERDDYELCIASPTVDLMQENELITTSGNLSGILNMLSATTAATPTSDGAWSTVWLIIGMLISGAGSAPQFVVGIPYIDDTVVGPSIPICIALIISSHFGGVWVGQMASFFMWHHINESDPQAFTRWWLGFFVAAMIAFVSGLVMFMFRDPGKRQPVILPEKSSSTVAAAGISSPEESSYYQRFRSDSADSDGVLSKPSRLSRLARNVSFISLTLGGAFEVAMLTGLLIFQPRFIGTVTGIGIAPAQLFLGSAVAFGVILGLSIGAGIIYFRKWSPKKLSRNALIASVPALCLTWSLFFFHCGDPNITGGIKNSETLINPSSNIHHLVDQINFTAPCDVDCPCSSVKLTPVCGTDHLTYLSPCFAGCKNVVEIDEHGFDGHKTLNFTDCTCVNGTKSNLSDYALSGACAVSCDPLWLYWLVLCTLFVFAGIQYTPQMLLVIRCVVPRDRTVALCILVVMWHLVGYIPALIYFSYALNKSCILWSDVNNPTYHECLIYDSSTHHLYICTLVVFLKSLAVLCIGVTYKYTKDAQEGIHSSGRNWVRYEALEMDSVHGTPTRNTREDLSPAYI